jgi:hypothetical protein
MEDLSPTLILIYTDQLKVATDNDLSVLMITVRMYRIVSNQLVWV